MTSFLPNALRSCMYLPSRQTQALRSAAAVLLAIACSTLWPVFALAQGPQNAREAEMGFEEEDYGEDDMDMEMDMDMDMDMEMEMEMEGYGGGYGGGRSSRGGTSTQDLVAARLSDALASAFRSTDLASLTNPEAAPPVQSGPVLINDATVAYAKGDYPVAMKLYFGHIVAEFDKAGNQLQMVKYSPLMKRPTWKLRWGISYAVRGDTTDPQPIQETASRSRPTGQGGFGGDDMDMDMEMEMEMEMGDGRGPRGRGRGQNGMSEEDMEMEMDMEMDMDMEMEMEMMGGGAGSRRRTAPPAGPPTTAARLASIERTMLSGEAEQELVTTVGQVASIIGAEFDKRYAEGAFGRAMTDVTEDSGSPETVSEGFVELLESSADPMPLWRPGIQFVGQGDSDNNTLLARKGNLDLMIHLDVLLKPLRGEYVQNICRCRLIHVPTGKSLGISGKIDSLEFAQKSRTKGFSSKDYIDEQLSGFFDIIDRQAITTDFPPLTREIAKRRVGMLLASGGGKNLRTLAEVRLFQSQQLLDEEDVMTAFDIVGGEEAMQLIFASEPERLRIVRKWAAGPTGNGE